ncbi:hypothetical protein BLNAU_12377 [Blattamonas nauphoetae]|uniref:Uncharacterized protein n=1 Tax=Blattamonas nauphoetae TaxID=2049346 RepID=A0ABQ9XN13_9EUKA|nr:hypothetical protein BLNAU_12377 [Blattamonas nauphoetae]
MGADESRLNEPRSILGAAAIERYNEKRWTVSGNVFTKLPREIDAASIESYEIGPVVARLSLIIRKEPTMNISVGIISPKLSSKALSIYDPFLKGGAGWNLDPDLRFAQQNWKALNKGSACLGGREGQLVVLEADGREGKRTLKLSQDGETQPVFFTNIPVPFRFAVSLFRVDDAVEIESLEVVSEPKMVGGTTPYEMEE